MPMLLPSPPLPPPPPLLGHIMYTMHYDRRTIIIIIIHNAGGGRCFVVVFILLCGMRMWALWGGLRCFSRKYTILVTEYIIHSFDAEMKGVGCLDKAFGLWKLNSALSWQNVMCNLYRRGIG